MKPLPDRDKKILLTGSAVLATVMLFALTAAVLAGTTYVDDIVVTNTFLQTASGTTNMMYGSLILNRQGDVEMGGFTNGPAFGDFLSIMSLPAANILSGSADFRGDLIDVGGENPSVSIFWGTNDGEQVKANWSTQTVCGVRAAGIVETNLCGLITNVPYYYRHYASNALNQAWASSSMVFIAFANDDSIVEWSFATSNNPTEDSSYIGTNSGVLGSGASAPTWVDALAATSACYYFDGGDRINAGGKPCFSFGNQSENASSTNDRPFTVMAWCKPACAQGWTKIASKVRTGMPGGGLEWSLWSCYGAAGSTYPVFDVYSTNSAYLYANMWGSGGLQTGLWTHVAGVCAPTGNIATAANLFLYTNGYLPSLQRGESGGKYLGMATKTNVSMCVGLSQCTNWGFIGHIDDFRLYTNALSQAQIQAIFNATTNTHPNQ